MLPIIVFFIQCINYGLQVFFIAQKIGMGCINKKGFDVMLFYVVGIGLLQVKKIFVLNILFVRAVAFFYIHLQFMYGGMQVNQDIGLEELLVNDIEQALIQPEFIFGQVDFGKEQAFGK